jgi:hypothetical protein
VCGLAGIKPEKYAGLIGNQQLITARKPYGDYTSYNDFYNLTVDARLPRGVRLGGGVDTGRSVVDSCFVVDSPQALLNCHITIPFKAQTQLKANGVVPFKGGFVASFALQNFSGPPITALYSPTNAEISPSLGRNLSGGLATPTTQIPLVPPQTLFEDRLTRLDLRFSKIFKVNRLRVQLNVDAYNALNSSGIRSVINAYGPRWQSVAQILDPRLIQVGGQISF